MPSHYKKKMPDHYKKTANQTCVYYCSHIMITFINLYSFLCFVLHIVLTCIRQESPNERYCNTMKDLPLLNAISQKDEKPYTAGLDDTTIHCVHIYQTGLNVIDFFFRFALCPNFKLSWGWSAKSHASVIQVSWHYKVSPTRNLKGLLLRAVCRPILVQQE